MRILIDVNHPAHVHLFRCAAREWESRGHQICWVARDKDLVLELLRRYGIEFQTLSVYQPGLTRMARELAIRDWKLFRIARQFRPDVMLGTSVNITHVSKSVPAHSIYFTESSPTETRLITSLSFPFADKIVTPDCLPDEVMLDKWKFKWVKHRSYHELAYLHPNHFTPDPSVLDELGVTPGETFFILRLIGWGASHDIGEKGLGLEARWRIIQALAPHGRVFITAESGLQPEFEPYRIHIEPHRIFDALHYATLLIGDSHTMVAEAAVLGTPAVRCNSMVGRFAYYVEELEHKYHLCSSFLPNEIDDLINKINELLQQDDIKSTWQEKRDYMLADKVDLTDWMVEFVETNSLNKE